MQKKNQQEEGQQHSLLTPISTPTATGHQQQETLQKTLQLYARKLQNSPIPNEKAAKGILKITPQLLGIYEAKLLDNIELCLRTNVEQELWKASFYTSIEALRKQAGNGGPHSAIFKEFLHQFIEQAINFYEELLKKYEQKFEFNLKNATLQWTINGEDRHLAREEDLADAIILDDLGMLTQIDKHVLRSTQRHLIYMGDLQRYRIQNQNDDQQEKKTYSSAKKFYQQAYTMETANGWPLNQLAVVASYEKNWIDILFYYARSLSVPIPFNSAQESLEIALNSLRTPAINFENSIWDLLDKAKKKNEKSEKKKIDYKGPYMDILANKNGKNAPKNYEEKWIHPSHRTEKRQQNEEIDKKMEANQMKNIIEELFNGEDGKNHQKKAIGHLLHSAGMLISYIGIENFKKSSKIGLNGLEQFIMKNEAILSPMKILKIIFLFTFSFHTSKTSASETLVEEQKKKCVEILFSLYGILLEIISNDLDKIGLFLLSGRLTKKILRLLPSLTFLNFWFHKNCANFHNLHLNINNSIWKQFCNFSNKLTELREHGELANCSTDCEQEEDKKAEYFALILPEFLLLSPYFDILPKQPNPIYISKSIDGKDLVGKDRQFLSVQARFALNLHLAEQLAKNEHFGFIKIKNGQFHLIDQPIVENNEQSLKNEEKTNDEEEMLDFAELNIDNENNKTTEKQITDEFELKKQLLNEEQQLFVHRWIVEVQPKYLVPDTNTFIDYLEEIQQLVQSNLFTLLIPTIVINELNSLMLGVPIAGFSILPRAILNPKGSREDFLMEMANTAIQWLRDASDKRIQNMRTVTSNGNILQLSFVAESAEIGKKKSNDDRILFVCVNLCHNLEKAGTTHSSTSQHQTQLERIVVLLTEDRGLSAKALAERIPVRTIPNFAKWALKKEKTDSTPAASGSK